MERCGRDLGNFKEHLADGLRTKIPQLKKDQIGYEQLILFRRKVNSLWLKFIIKERKEKWIVKIINQE